MRSSHHGAKPGQVDHHTPSAHWCGDCWHWVVDCDHVINGLSLKHRTVDDAWIRSLAYDRYRGRLEVDFKWNDIRQFWPVSPALFRELWIARPMHLVMDRITKDKRIRSEFVRSERKLVRVLLRCLALIPA